MEKVATLLVACPKDVDYPLDVVREQGRFPVRLGRWVRRQVNDRIHPGTRCRARPCVGHVQQHDLMFVAAERLQSFG